MPNRNARYWNDLADCYQQDTHISCDDFHYGPMLPGESGLQLLPPDLQGLSCLELGCGGAQNSIFLARQGAICTAIDLAARQLTHARRLANQHQVQITFIIGDIEQLPLREEAQFDLIHSAYALPFTIDQASTIAQAARRLRSGGQLLISTAHPLFAGEWLDLDGQTGMFLENYLQPPRDHRQNPDHSGATVCQPLPISAVTEAMAANGLELERLLEPLPSPEQAPYHSPAWHELYPEMTRFPAVIIFKARKK